MEETKIQHPKESKIGMKTKAMDEESAIIEFNNNVHLDINSRYGYPTPNRQNLTADLIMNNLFFTTDYEFLQIQRAKSYDFIVIGTGPCAYSFMSQALENKPNARILCIDRGQFFLPEHFQNLPLAFSTTVGINGLTETYPWTLSYNTENNKSGYIKFQRGMIPMFGGRSILWSAWCPRPTKEQLKEWPTEIQNRFYPKDGSDTLFKRAEKLLNVIPTNDIAVSENANSSTNALFLYGDMQKGIYTLLQENKECVPEFHRIIYAPLAVGSEEVDLPRFSKWSTCGPMLELIQKYGKNLDIVTNCIVKKIVNQNVPNLETSGSDEDTKYDGDGSAKTRAIITALQTSRGDIKIGDAKLVLGMGMYPATTLVANSFPKLPNVGDRLSAHFITSITARFPRKLLAEAGKFKPRSSDLGAIFLDGTDKETGLEFHIQLSIISDTEPDKHKLTLFRYAPDVVATASAAQLQDSKDYIVFVCAVLGELDYHNKNTFFKRNENDDESITENMLLQMLETERDLKLWDCMDRSTFDMLEKMLIKDGKEYVEYWHGSSTEGEWKKGERPSKDGRRVPGVVHESSCMHIGDEKTDDKAVVNCDYQLKGVNDVYITGGSLWPRGGSWNPTLTMCAMAQDLADKLSK